MLRKRFRWVKLRMLMFYNAKLVLLAVPKTGSSAIEDALGAHADCRIENPPEQKHCTLRRYRRQLKPFFEGNGRRLDVMAVIREPVSWLSSWHRYRARDAIKGKPQSTQGIDFDTFIENWLKEDPPAFAKVGRQSRFVDWHGGRAGVDHLFRHDKMEDAVSFLEDRLKREITLPRMNVSGGTPVQPSEAMLERLKSEAPEEFALWDALCDGKL